ncbi:MAG: hypothetical protein CFE24_14565 [Flavobacterium sp. BFFFF2]|nr:MAG: hypothetical protein CFE24_14565 [Flavobacterium sp. BFFFF2]
MKTKLIAFILISTLISSCADNKNKESFEGIITYKISFFPKTNNAEYNDYQKQKNGSKLKTYISKDGSFKKEYLSSGEKGFDFVIYNSIKNKIFAKWRNIDTTYASSCSVNNLSLEEEKDLPIEKIYGQECEGYFISGTDPKTGQKIILKYFYPENKEYLNPIFYKNFKDGFYDKVTEKMKSPFYKMSVEMENYTVIFEVEKIEKTTVNPKLFEVPSGIPINEIK